MTNLMINAQQVCKSFGQLEVLKGIDLQVPQGEVACLIGPSGSGKSTFLRCVNHLEKVTAGRLYVDGELIGYRERDGVLHEISEKDAARQRADIGMVFQQFNLFPHRTALENVIEAPVHVKGMSVVDAKRRGLELLDQVGLAHKAGAYPVQLSGGQQQRVAIARAVAYQPEVLVMDEPFAAVDAQTRADLEDLVRRVWKDLGVTVLFVTHDIDESVYLGERVVVLSASPTVVQEDLAVDLPAERDQLGTRALPRFTELRTHVYGQIQRAKRGEQVGAA